MYHSCIYFVIEKEALLIFVVFASCDVIYQHLLDLIYFAMLTHNRIIKITMKKSIFVNNSSHFVLIEMNFAGERKVGWSQVKEVGFSNPHSLSLSKIRNAQRVSQVYIRYR